MYTSVHIHTTLSIYYFKNEKKKFNEFIYIIVYIHSFDSCPHNDKECPLINILNFVLNLLINLDRSELRIMSNRKDHTAESKLF